MIGPAPGLCGYERFLIMTDIEIVSVDRWRNDDPDGRTPAGTVWHDVSSDIEVEPHPGITIEQMQANSEPAKYWK